jgi:DNA-binding XRE family transcriptional regulator
LGLFQKEVAAQIGVTASTIFNWEKNDTNPPPRYIRAIINFLGYNPLLSPASLSEKLFNTRRLLGLNQMAMANRLKIDPTTLASWEKGKRRPSRKLWKRIELLLDAICSGLK